MNDTVPQDAVAETAAEPEPAVSETAEPEPTVAEVAVEPAVTEAVAEPEAVNPLDSGMTPLPPDASKSVAEAEKAVEPPKPAVPNEPVVLGMPQSFAYQDFDTTGGVVPAEIVKVYNDAAKSVRPARIILKDPNDRQFINLINKKGISVVVNTHQELRAIWRAL